VILSRFEPFLGSALIRQLALALPDDEQLLGDFPALEWHPF